MWCMSVCGGVLCVRVSVCEGVLLCVRGYVRGCVAFMRLCVRICLDGFVCVLVGVRGEGSLKNKSQLLITQ